MILCFIIIHEMNVLSADVDRCGEKKPCDTCIKKENHATDVLHLVLRNQANINFVEANSVFVIVLGSCSDLQFFFFFSFKECIVFIRLNKLPAMCNKQCRFIVCA